VNRIKNVTYRCHHEILPVDYTHKKEKKMYCKFSVILCLNMLIRLYLLKYVLICIYFEVTNLSIEIFFLHFNEKTF